MNTKTHHPDILTCFSHLSQDEILTPPRLVGPMLDLLPKTLWSNPDATFLDPCCKTGVFLREITKRLWVGLETVIPDPNERLRHILTQQVYGIAITPLTALFARRTLYGSKSALEVRSIARSFFQTEAGHIFYTSASSSDNETIRLRNGQYPFLTETFSTLKEVLPVKFDVIIGNPPYQLEDGGGDGSSAGNLFHKFIEQAKALSPDYISMIVPARWYSGGKGLDSFRREMIADDRLKEIHDFRETRDCFPGLNIRGGICYFLWDANYHGSCKVVNYVQSEPVSTTQRYLNEASPEVFIRYNEAMGILEKIQAFHEETMIERVHARNHFNIPSSYKDYTLEPTETHTLRLYRSDRQKNSPKQVYMNPDVITKHTESIAPRKVLVSKASPGGDEFPHAVFSAPVIATPESACTETYLIVDFAKTEAEAEHIQSYLQTKFFRFLVLLVKSTQNISRACFLFVPVQSWDENWTDEKLYAKYGLTDDEIAFIESLVKPMKGTPSQVEVLLTEEEVNQDE